MTTYLVTCPSCGSSNRIPSDKEGLRGRCGSCRSPLPPLYSHPRPLSDSSFDGFIGSYPGPVLVEFWAPW